MTPTMFLKSYNEFSQLAPHAADKHALTRAWLRKNLQFGGDQIDPVEIDQLLNIENKLKDQNQLPGHSGLRGKGPLGDVLNGQK
jgi:hypothetical protein